MSYLKRIKELYSNRFGKAISEDQGYFTSMLITINNEEFLICLPRSLYEYIYGKIISLKNTSFLDCNRILLDPRGLFIFARSPEEFVEKTYAKALRMIRNE